MCALSTTNYFKTLTRSVTEGQHHGIAGEYNELRFTCINNESEFSTNCVDFI